ncbi:uncharacterized protein PV06_08457 [Exophiala oligosperma]|uniref:Uncharacterized protein n=1 Tax=Exophiala oligosperma TaxID=215243 RepID=A0A0D2DBN2_9EURO|nr:uncharacterized protein PV06_08457 [Exophiala oligosperma]KIW39885.1 hypothetical protein PV06_08457 [Exophiala oligosperma]
MASTVVLATPTASPTVFPTAGIGGEYYTNPLFEVPVYTGYARSAITWQMLDAWNIVGLQYAVAEGIACGLIWATFIYLLALTPSRKRSTRFHIILFTGLCFETTHLTMDAISLVTPGLSANSAYLVLTRDMASSVWTTSYKAFYTSTQALNWVAFICATTCLWIQAQGLLTTLKVRSSIAYVVVLVYLVSAALATLIASLVYWIYQIKVIPDNIDWDMALYARKLRNIYLLLYAISIGSFSLVNLFSVLEIMWRRPFSIIKSESVYHSALNLLGLLGIQSCLVPLIFCIMQIVYTGNEWVLPALLLPSVYLILPLGTLFVTINATNTTTTTTTDDNETRKGDGEGVATSPRKLAADMMSPLKKRHVQRDGASSSPSPSAVIMPDDSTVVEAPSVVIDWADQDNNKVDGKAKTLEV